jgi:hypothetical protein
MAMRERTMEKVMQMRIFWSAYFAESHRELNLLIREELLIFF